MDDNDPVGSGEEFQAARIVEPGAGNVQGVVSPRWCPRPTLQSLRSGLAWRPSDWWRGVARWVGAIACDLI